MKLILIFISILICGNSLTPDCGADRLCRSMVSLNPDGDIRMFQELSFALQEMPFVNPYVAVAIAYQESGLRFADTGKDVGIFQFHEETIKRFGLDRNKLMTDVKYNVAEFYTLMKEKYMNCYQDYPDTWWACWHSSTPDKHFMYAGQIFKHLKTVRNLP